MMEVNVTLTTLAVFVVILILFLVGLLVYLYPASGKSSSIPGPNPSDAKEGNISDLRKAGSLQEYLGELHGEYGDLTGFWHGQNHIVSVASIEYFAPRSQIFEVPDVLFEGWRPLVGDDSYIFSTGLDVFKRRENIDFDVTLKSKEHYSKIFCDISKEIVEKWRSVPEGQHVPLTQHLKGLATKAVCRMLGGDFFKDSAKVIKLHKAWEHCWSYVESVALQDDAVNKEKDFSKNRDILEKILVEAVAYHTSNEDKNKPVILEKLLRSSNQRASESKLVSDVITQLTIGMHVTHSVLLWTLYYVATHSDVQDRLRKEFATSGDATIMPESIAKNKYVQAVMKEAVRCGTVFLWTGRKQDIDITVGGHVVAKNTPVIEAIGEAMMDEKLFPDPALYEFCSISLHISKTFDRPFSRYDPDRFMGKGLDFNPLSYIPFAFGGSRKAPEDSLVYLLGAVLLCNVVRRLKLGIAGDNPKNLCDPDYATMVSRPSKEELWAVVSPVK